MGEQEVIPGLMTNRTSQMDFVENSLSELSRQPCTVCIAVAFYTNSEPVLRMAKQGCQVRMVVRLGFPTSPNSLKDIFGRPNILIRYVTDRHFHPKLYWFGEKGALVGSANLTGDALKRNQEVVLHVPLNDARFDQLGMLFNEYWRDAEPLSESVLTTYEEIFERHRKAQGEMDVELQNKLPKVFVKNITIATKAQTKDMVFLDDYRKNHQEFQAEFKNLEEIYRALGRRKVLEKLIPLRLEIDSFISFVREIEAPGIGWEESLTGDQIERKIKIKMLVEKWLASDWGWFTDHIVKKSYPKMKLVFATRESIVHASDDELYEGLLGCHAFKESRRYFGGVEKSKAIFFNNGRTKINEVLTYLIHGDASPEVRMCHCIFDEAFFLKSFGRSSIQELVGWVGKESLPVCNARTTKVMHYLGFKVRQLDDM